MSTVQCIFCCGAAFAACNTSQYICVDKVPVFDFIFFIYLKRMCINLLVVVRCCLFSQMFGFDNKVCLAPIRRG